MTFKRVLTLEVKHRLRLRNVIIFALIGAFLLLVVQHGKSKYENIVGSKKVFQEMENTRVTQYVLYRQYGAFGLNFLFIPSPYSIIYNDYAFEGLVSSVNTAEKLSLDKSIKGKEFLSERSGFISIAWILLILIGFGSLIYGYHTARSQAFSKLLSDMTNSWQAFWTVLLSRVIILNIAALLLAGIPFFYLLVTGINLFKTPTLYLGIGLILVTSFFYLLGNIVGCLPDSIRGVVLTVVFFVSILGIPALMEVRSEISAGDIEPLLQFKSKSFKLIMEIDKQLITKYGSSTAPPSAEFVNAVLDAVKNDHGKIRKRECDRKNKILEKVKQDQTISALFPVLFYLSLNKEISSHGGLSFIDFYSFTQLRKREFIDFYVRKRFLSNDKPDRLGPVENFIKKDENIFYAHSQLPANLGFGFMVSIGWLGVLMLISWMLFRKSFPRSYDPPGEESQLKLKENKIKVVITSNRDRVNKLIAGFRYQYPRLICMPNWSCLPGESKVRWYFTFFNLPVPERLQPVAGKKCSALNPNQRAMILTEILRSFDADIFVFHNFLNGLSDEFIDYFADFLVDLKKGRKVVYFSNTLTVSPRIGDSVARFTDDPPF
jgi:hypothetical protein